MSWARADFASFRLWAKALLTPLHGFLANSRSIGDEKRGNMHQSGHFAADFLQVRQAASRAIDR